MTGDDVPLDQDPAVEALQICVLNVHGTQLFW